jgi:Na+-transporting methylmalonyl-CoA/oxaloacetate decarboxylase gamma subunit
MKRVLLIIIATLGVASVAAQGVNNVRINEVLVVNENNYVDDYGHRPSWIELFNNGYEAVNIGGCYLVATKADGTTTRYNIPKGDPATQMHSQTYLVFFCEGTDTKGTFYTNFTLDGVEKLELMNQGGKEAISSFSLASLPHIPDVSVGWMRPEGDDEAVIMELPKTTPNATNESTSGVPKHEVFRQRDSSGVVMAIIAMSVVFSALLLIFLVLKGFGAVMIWFGGRKDKKPVSEVVPQPKKKPASVQVEEEMAAIALAIKMYQEDLHIRESTVITINRASRVYSPWSSKIHGITPMPDKK